MILKIDTCARCNKDHLAVEFHRFRNPPMTYTHWGVCPETKEPILMYVEQEPIINHAVIDGVCN